MRRASPSSRWRTCCRARVSAATPSTSRCDTARLLLRGAALNSHASPPSHAQSDAFGESLLGCGAALLELSAEDELILVRAAAQCSTVACEALTAQCKEGALLAARAFFDGPAAGKTPHAAKAAGGEGWFLDAKSGNEELGALTRTTLFTLLSVR